MACRIMKALFEFSYRERVFSQKVVSRSDAALFYVLELKRGQGVP